MSAECYAEEYLRVGKHSPMPGQPLDYIQMQDRVALITDASKPMLFFLHKHNIEVGRPP